MRILPLSILLLILSSSSCGHRHVETGIASWYGPGFRGKATASGDKFRPSKLTAAHKTLPLGTVVVVKRLDTGERVRVLINDRGPYVAGRIIDLSKKAGRRIGLMEDGHAEVKIKVVGCRDKFGKCP
jgi:rare lipoprotein A